MSSFTRRDLLAGVAVAQLGGAPAAAQQDERLNLIHIGVDTWSTHWLGCYGATQVRTPHVDALAAKSARFADCFPEVLPTIPARRSIYTGRRIFPSDLILQRDDQVRIRGWHQLYAEDVTLSETLKAAGYTTAIISDIYHQFKPDKNFHRGFDSWRWIRGQETDRLESGPRRAVDVSKYLHASQPPAAAKGVLQYLLNRREWKSEDDWCAAQVFREAARWIDNNAAENQPFYLHLESFSPHEFWDPPEDYYRMYMKGDYRGPRLVQPPMTTSGLSPLEVEHVRALYAGLVTFVDAQIGRFLDRVESAGLMKNTAIIFVADHGTMMGEQGQVHKGEQRLRTQVTHVPLLVYHPRKSWGGRVVTGYAQHTDILPTACSLTGVPPPARATGLTLVPWIERECDCFRAQAITGWGEHAALRDLEWLYITRWSEGARFEELYRFREDPLELSNVIDKHPRVAADLRAKLRKYIEEGWATTRGTFATKLA